MLLIRGSRPWCGVSFLGGHFSAAVCHCPLIYRFILCNSILSCPVMWQTISASGIVYNACFFVMRLLMPFLVSLTWMQIYRRKALLAHRTMIIFVYGYTLYRKSSMSNPYKGGWVPTPFCENPSLSSTKDSLPDLRDLVVI